MLDLIREHPFGESMDERAVNLIAGCARNAHFPAGTYIQREGEAADRFYLLRHGLVALELNVDHGEPVVFTTVKGGEVLGASWLVPPYRLLDSARAVEAVKAIEFDAKCLREKCEADPAVGFDLMKRFVPVLTQRMHRACLQGANIYAAKAS